MYGSGHQTGTVGTVSVTGPSHEMAPFSLVVVVASLGGLEAISSLLTDLPATFPVPLLVVQHGRRSEEPDRLSCLLQRSTTLPVQMARPGQRVDTPGVIVIPGGAAAIVDQMHTLRIIDGDGFSGGDALLSSAAAVL
jgi:two-component system, chemotaxis family, protein-glutamate methylesterase/glutaminase